MKARLILCVAALAVMPPGFSGVALAQSPPPELTALSFAKKLKLAKTGDANAELAVGEAWEAGIGVKLSRREAAKWYRLAAGHGNREAQFRLGRIVQEGDEGLKKSPELARKLYETAARQGHRGAENWYGYCWQHGIGGPQDYDKARLWYHRALDQGFVEAANNLGLLALNGLGAPQNRVEAFQLFAQAAAAKNSWGLNNLGGLYELGSGTTRDREKALALYREAADLGNATALANYTRLAHESGQDGAAQPSPLQQDVILPPKH